MAPKAAIPTSPKRLLLCTKILDVNGNLAVVTNTWLLEHKDVEFTIHAPMMWSAVLWDNGKHSRVLMLSFVTCSRHICVSGTPGCLLYLLSKKKKKNTLKSRMCSIFDTSSPPPHCFWWIKSCVVCHCDNGVTLISISVLSKQFQIVLSPIKIQVFVSWVGFLKALWDFLRQLTLWLTPSYRGRLEEDYKPCALK